MSSTSSRDPNWRLKIRLERLSDAVDELEAVLVDEEPLDTVEDAFERIRSTIIELEESL